MPSFSSGSPCCSLEVHRWSSQAAADEDDAGQRHTLQESPAPCRVEVCTEAAAERSTERLLWGAYTLLGCVYMGAGHFELEALGTAARETR
jgi:hypothetical protein